LGVCGLEGGRGKKFNPGGGGPGSLINSLFIFALFAGGFSSVLLKKNKILAPAPGLLKLISGDFCDLFKKIPKGLKMKNFPN